MPGDKPSAWATKQAEAILAPTCIPLAVTVIDQIAHALDAAEQRGREAERAACVAYLRGPAVNALNILDVADDIERGEHHPKEGV